MKKMIALILLAGSLMIASAKPSDSLKVVKKDTVKVAKVVAKKDTVKAHKKAKKVVAKKDSAKTK